MKKRAVSTTLSHPSATRQSFRRSNASPHIEVRTTIRSRLPYAMHFHASFSLGLVTSGTTMLECKQGAIVLRRGDMVAIGPEQPHSCNPVQGKTRSYHMFNIESVWLEQQLNYDGLRLGVEQIRNKALFDRLVRFATAVSEGTDDSEGERALVQCFRAVCTAHEQPKSCSDRAAELLAAQPATRAAAMLGMRRETLSRTFRRAHGLPPAAYRQCLRLAKARRMLAEGAEIANAAIDCGFTDQSHLHRTCVKYLAATPNQLRATRSHLYKTK